MDELKAYLNDYDAISNLKELFGCYDGCPVYCNNCACGIAISAIKHKNRRPAPENKPLTLEQLRQMEGEPVWLETGEVSINEQIIGRWAIIHSVSDLYMHCMDGGSEFSKYGKTWLAYARKPEQEEK